MNAEAKQQVEDTPEQAAAKIAFYQEALKSVQNTLRATLEANYKSKEAIEEGLAAGLTLERMQEILDNSNAVYDDFAALASKHAAFGPKSMVVALVSYAAFLDKYIVDAEARPPILN